MATRTPQKKTLKTIKDKATEEQNKIVVPEQSEFEVAIADEAARLFRQWRDNRNQVFKLFGDYTLVDYIDDSVYRYTTSVYERDDMEDWQSRANVPMTRNKINNISGRAIQSLPIGQVKIPGLGKFRRQQILNNLYEFSEDKNAYAFLMSEAITEAMVKGTTVVYEGHIKEVNLERDISSTGNLTEKQLIHNRLFSQVVNLEDFYPSTVFVSTIEELTGAAWREILKIDEFRSKYGEFEISSKIPGYSAALADYLPSFRDDSTNIIGEGNVEVLHIYKKNTDEYIILANRFWLNPVKIAETDKCFVSPIPFKHKQLPFFLFKFEPLAANFLYGKSMPDKFRESQDMLNAMTNMVFDSSVIALNPMIISASADYIEDDIIRPGRRIAIDTQGEPINSVIQELKISPPTGWYQYILQHTKGIIEESSVDQLSSGSASGLPDRTTAKAVELAAAGIASSLSYFGLQIQEAIKRKTKLRIGNILQTYFDNENPLVQYVTGETPEYINSAFNKFTLENAELEPDEDGKIRRGRKIIEVYESKAKMPDSQTLRAQASVEKASTGKEVQIVAIPKDYIRDMFDMDVVVVADKRLESNKATEQAVALYKVQTYSSLFPDLINRNELASELMESLGDDPTRLLLSFEEQEENKMQAQMAGEEGQGGGQMPGVGGGSANNMGNNLTQQIAGATPRVTQ